MSEEALNNIQLMPIMVELDSESTTSETEKAINGLTNNNNNNNFYFIYIYIYIH